MDKSEAKVILGIMTTADGGCSHCASALFRYFLERWPEYAEVADEAWYEAFDWEDERAIWQKEVSETRKATPPEA